MVAVGQPGVSQPARVLIMGAGPTGLVLALQAHAHGAHVRIIERKPELFRPSRALILHPRTLEVLRPLGVTEQLLSRADTAPRADIHTRQRIVPVGLGELALHDTKFPHLSFLRQADAEAVLCAALQDRGIAVEWGTRLIDAQDGPDQARALLQSKARSSDPSGTS